MSTPNSAMVYTQGFGSKPEFGSIISTVNPGTTFSPTWHIGQQWVNTSANTVYVLTSISTSGGVTTPTWTLLESEGGALNTLTGGSGGAISPSANNITLAGTANQITTTGSGSTITFAVPSSPSFGGTVTSATGFTATTGNITATNGNLVMSHVGNKLVIPASSSATCSAGQFTLAGAATTIVSNSAVTASSLILLTTQVLGTVSAASTLAVTAQSAGVSFTVTPSQSTDTSVVNYLIIN
jgi:hypothetical protein